MNKMAEEETQGKELGQDDAPLDDARRQKIIRQVVPDAELRDTFVRMIALEVSDLIRKRLTVPLAAVAIVASMVVAGAVVWVQDRIEDSTAKAGRDTQEHVRQFLTSQAKRSEDELKKESDYLRFVSVALMLEGRTESFTEGEKNSAMAQLRTIAQYGSLRRRHYFPVYLNKVVEKFVAANLRDEIDEIAELYDREIRESDRLMQSMLAHYGQRLLGSSVGPERWPEKDVESFARYEQAADAQKHPHWAVAFRLVIEFRRNGSKRTPATADLLLGVKHFKLSSQRFAVLRNLVRYSDPAIWMTQTSPYGMRVATLFQSFLKEHKAECRELLSDDLVLKRSKREMDKHGRTDPMYQALSKFIKLRDKPADK